MCFGGSNMAFKPHCSKLVILTRAHEDAKKIQLDFEERGFKTLSFPVLKTHYLELPKFDLSQFQGIILTSQKALSSLKKGLSETPTRSSKNLTLFCVGDQIPNRLKSFEFKACLKAPSAQALQIKIQNAHLSPLLYLSARDIKVPLDQNLQAFGIDVQRLTAYEMQPLELDISSLQKSMEFYDQIIFPFYSKRTLQIFSQQIAAYALNFERSIALVISEDLRQPAMELGFQETHVSPSPTHKGLLEALEAFL